MTPKATERAALALLLRLEANARKRLRGAVHDVGVHYAKRGSLSQAPITLARILEVEIERIRAEAAKEAEASIHDTVRAQHEQHPELAALLLLLLRQRRPRLEQPKHAAHAIADRTAAVYARALTEAEAKFLKRGIETTARRQIIEAELVVRARIDTIAATETASNYSTYRQAAVEAIPLPDLDVDWMKTWDAVLDAHVCPECAALDGTTVTAFEHFPGGLIPGNVHPRCRCMAHFFLKRREERAAA